LKFSDSSITANKVSKFIGFFGTTVIGFHLFTIVAIMCQFSFITDLSLEDRSIMQCYLLGLYFTVNTLTTLGLGDVTPKVNEYVFLVFFFQLAGLLMYGFCFRSISKYVKELIFDDFQDLAEEDFINWLVKREKGGTYSKGEVIEFIKKFYIYQLKRNPSQVLGSRFYNDLPIGVKKTIFEPFRKKLGEKFLFFRLISQEDIIFKLSLGAIPQVYSYGDKVLEHGVIATGLFFIVEGNVGISIKGIPGIEIIRYGPGSCFGDVLLIGKAFNRQIEYFPANL